MAKALSLYDHLSLVVNDVDEEAEVAAQLEGAGAAMAQVQFFRIPTVDVWFRDYGPTFVVNREDRRLGAIDWIFNAWGGKYEPYAADDGVAPKILRGRGIHAFAPKMVLEGGSIEVNGEGVCLTTEQCLLNRNRNPHMSRDEIETLLRNYLGVERVIWLGEGVAGDDTDGHIDDIARFVDPTTVVTAVETNERDENYRPLRENLERLQAATNRSGGRFRVIPLPMPGAVAHDGERFPASYANFYVANEAILVPTFDDPNDGAALGLLGELFPGRKVIGIPCRAVVLGLGAVHCVTQQEPLV